MLKLSFISPFFIVSNINDSVTFYVRKLGFEVWHIGPGGDPYWALVGRGPVSIMLKAITKDIKPIPNHTQHEWASGMLTFALKNLTPYLKNTVQMV